MDADVPNPYAAPGDPGYVGQSFSRAPIAGRRPRSWWHYFGLAVAIALGVAGLAALAFFVMMAIALNQWAHNK